MCEAVAAVPVPSVDASFASLEAIGAGEPALQVAVTLPQSASGDWYPAFTSKVRHAHKLY